MTIELGKGTPRSAAMFKIDDLTARKIDAIYKLHLRHPGMIARRIVKLLAPGTQTYSGKELNDIAIEWRRLHPGGENP
jgi:hypothetical protein